MGAHSGAPQPSGERRRDAIIAFIEEFWEQHSYGPTMYEIAIGSGLTSASSAKYHVHLLVRAGCLQQSPGVTRALARSIRVVE